MRKINEKGEEMPPVIEKPSCDTQEAPVLNDAILKEYGDKKYRAVLRTDQTVVAEEDSIEKLIEKVEVEIGIAVCDYTLKSVVTTSLK